MSLVHHERRVAAGDRRLARAIETRVVIEHVSPQVDGGRFPIKRTVGDSVEVTADIFADGHDVIAAVLRDRPTDNVGAWHETPMTLAAPGLDRWAGRFEVAELGWHEYQIVAWVDPFLTWQRDLEVKTAAGQDVSVELLEGPRLLEKVDAHGGRPDAATSNTLRVWVDRERARVGAWYEMFPRSAGPDASRSGTFAEAAALLPRIADLGFDVVYLPPIHPIGTTARRGRNNAPTPEPGDPGSPWAIGSAEGGHTAIEPGLGTLDDFDRFQAEAARLGLEIALDLAWQCSPDHPWVREHPEWFRHRPDGTIKHAENPPKQYFDIYPLDFACEDWRGLWQALLDVTTFWIARGVKIFRVDNPHTKPFGFWEWLIDSVHASDPGVIFLAEAFTRPRVMHYLAKTGFTQSYTYFTWRNTRDEITDYFSGLATEGALEYLRPNLFANTPDILHAYLQQGGRPAFQARLILAATLGATYGIYSGFELCEGRALRPGSEEYADSEKYELRKWDWNRPGHITELVLRLNRIRRRERALQFDRTLQFHATDNPEIIAYSKTVPDGSGRVFVVVNLDPHHMQHGHVEYPGVDPDEPFTVRDRLDDAEYRWRGAWNYVRFDPEVRQAHVLVVRGLGTRD